MKKTMVSFVALVVLSLSAATVLAWTSKEEGRAVEDWIKTLADLKETNIPLTITQNNLPVVFNLRDVPVVERLSIQKNDYGFDLFLIVDARGMILPPGINCYVEDFVMLETRKKAHVFIKMRVAGIPTPVWTSLTNLEYALW
jgi:hypothetical protein